MTLSVAVEVEEEEEEEVKEGTWACKKDLKAAPCVLAYS
jgi:hypothetical protein